MSDRAESLDYVLQAIGVRCKEQDSKWGVNPKPLNQWVCILAEEFGEVAKAINEGELTDIANELIDLAAVASNIFVDIKDWMDED